MLNFIKRTGIFLQVRINSNRLPGKAIMDIYGKPLVLQSMERLSVIPADVRAILTTKESENYFIEIAGKKGWYIFTGDEQNVLKRFIEAAKYFKVNTIIRATADNPLLSSEIATETIDLFNKSNCDIAYLDSIPYGTGVEVINTEALISAYNNTNVPYHLEHVTPYIYEHKEKYKIKCAKFHDEDISVKNVRLTVDTREDYEKINYLFRNLEKYRNNMKIKSIIKIYNELKPIQYRRILFITGFSEFYGSGHLKRSIYLADKLKNNFEIFFSIKHGNKNDIKEILKYNNLEYNKLESYIKTNGLFDRVILDIRDSNIEEMLFYKKIGPTLSIDDMGEGGQISDIAIRTLPSINEHSKLKFNFDGLEYLLIKIKKHRNREKPKSIPKKILITFGGTDPGNLTLPITKAFEELDYNTTVIAGQFFKNKITAIGKSKIVSHVSDLEEYIQNTDIVVTSFGITFIEALILEKPVILINPSDYHDKLTVDFNYPYMVKLDKEKEEFIFDNVKLKIKDIIDKMINQNIFKQDINLTPLTKFFHLNIGNKTNDLINFIKIWEPLLPVCPNCSTINDTYIHRIQSYNMIKCKKCDLIYLVNLNNKENKKYENNYFIEEYKSTYGKTYIDDKHNIVEFAKKRVAKIKTYLTGGKLLDFGSGMGFFSEYCEKNGFKTTSIDISKYAVNYMKDKLKLNAINTNETYLEKNEEFFDVITSFFVIEHFNDFKKLLFLFYCHLKKNGVLALSTPNSKGISIRKNFKNYINNHPDDHLLIFSPNFLKFFLKKIGFKNIKINITGIHLDRFKISKKLLKYKLINNILTFYVKLFQLGDTFEIYAQKE